MSKSGLKVFAPASVANAAVGYDILGFAIEGIGDDVLVRQGSKKGLTISEIHHNKSLSKDISKNTAGFAASRLLKDLGYQDEPIDMVLYKNMPIGTGLGSSASSAVAGVFAVNEYLGRPLDKKALLKYAVDGESVADGARHADNVGPSLLGSFILLRDNESLDFVKLPSPPGLKIIIAHPEIEILTKDSRALLNSQVPLNDHIRQSGHLGCFVASLYRMDFELMKRSMHDFIIEPQRAHLIPEFKTIQTIAYEQGAICCSISGAGPSIFALALNTPAADLIEESWTRHFKDHHVSANIFQTKIDSTGAKKY